MQREIPLSSAEALVFLGFNITMRYISLHFTWRISEHERSRWAKERIKASAECGGERWDTIISHGRSTVGYYSIPRSRVTRGHHALKQYGVRELLFVISYRRFDLTKDFQDVCYL
jgi:hypothetical protein